jgi:hypothetical protein
MLFATADLSLGTSFGCFPFFPVGTAKLAAGGAFSLSFSDPSSERGNSDKTGGMSVVKGTVTGGGNLSVSLMPGPVEELGPAVPGTCSSGDDSVGVELVADV